MKLFQVTFLVFLISAIALGQSTGTSSSNPISGPVLGVYDLVISVIGVLRDMGFSVFESITKFVLNLLPILSSVLKFAFGLLSQIPIVGHLLGVLGNGVAAFVDGLTPIYQGLIHETHDLLNVVFLFNNVSQFSMIFPATRTIVSTVVNVI